VEDLEGVPREVGEEDVVMAAAVEEADFPVAEDEEALAVVVAEMEDVVVEEEDVMEDVEE